MVSKLRLCREVLLAVAWMCVSVWVSRCAVLLSADARFVERDDNRAAGFVVAPDGDFQLMYVRRFLREVGEGTIPDRVFEGNYDQLVIYLRGCLNQ